MTSGIGAALAAIAAVFATVGFILFGKPKSTESQSVNPTEQVQPEVKPIIPDVPVEPKGIAPQPLPPQADASTDPWADEPIKSSETLTLDTVEQPENIVAASGEEVPAEEVNLDNATQVVEPISTQQSGRSVPTARYSSESPTVGPSIDQLPFVAIQDPQRPAGLELQALSQKILAWGESGMADDLKNIMSYGTHLDPMIRRYVAVALGQTALKGAIGADALQSAVPVLDVLAKDDDTKVQKMAAKSLKIIQH